MSAPREIMSQVVKTLKPMNDVVTEFVTTACKSDFGGDRLLLQVEALGKAFGPLFNQLDKVDDFYQAQLTRQQLASIAIFYREAMSLLQIGAESRLEAVDLALKDEKLMNRLINKPTDEEHRKSSEFIAMCQNEDLIERLAAGIRREMRKNPDELSKELARSMVNNVALQQNDARVIGLFKDLVIGEITSTKEAAVQDQAQAKATAETQSTQGVTTSTTGNVIKIHFAKPATKAAAPATASV